jgi:hypothetical protein
MEEMDVSLHSGPIGEPGEGRGSIYWELRELAEGGQWLWKIYLYGSSVRGTWSWGSFAGSPEGYESKGMGISNSLHGGSGNLEWATGNFRRWLKGALDVRCLSLCGSSVKGLWGKGSLAGDPGGSVEKTLETGLSPHRGPIGNLLEGLSTGDFERRMKGALGMEHLTLKRLREGLEGGSLLYW